MNWLDTHLHLDAPEFNADRDGYWQRAHEAGVTQAVVPAVMAATFDDVLAMREQYGVAVAFGLHPLYLAQHQPEHLLRLEHYLQQHAPVAVGECGIDLYVPGLDQAAQEALLLAQLKLARKYDLPVILHVRRSQDRVLKCLRQVKVRGGIAHAFNGSEQQAQAFIDLGFCLGFGGAMTYHGSQRIRRLAATLPLTAIVLETDGPDIPPAWAQAVPNGPENLPRFGAELAALRGCTLTEITIAMRENAHRVLPGLAR